MNSEQLWLPTQNLYKIKPALAAGGGREVFISGHWSIAHIPVSVPPQANKA